MDRTYGSQSKPYQFERIKIRPTILPEPTALQKNSGGMTNFVATDFNPLIIKNTAG